MPTQVDGKTEVRIVFYRGEGTPDAFCGTCPAAQDDWIGNRPPHCARFGQQCQGTPDHVLRCPACLDAGVQHAELAQALADHQDMLQTAAEDYTATGYADGYNAGMDAAKRTGIGPETERVLDDAERYGTGGGIPQVIKRALATDIRAAIAADGEPLADLSPTGGERRP